MTNLCDSGLAFGSWNMLRPKKKKGSSGVGLAKIKDCNIKYGLQFFFFVMVVKSALVLVNL